MSKLNLYICSTVRHLLFALCRASQDGDDHEILFFSDYQNSSLDGWQLDSLPENVRVTELSRKEFRGQLESTAAGRLWYQYAMRCLPGPRAARASITETLAASAPRVAAKLSADDNFSLWLFNERNRMARVFRLMTNTFSIIEDGESNYLYYPIVWWKSPIRLLRRLPTANRFLGDDPRCTEIWVNYPERLPPAIRAKGKLIDFLDGPSVAHMIRRLMSNYTLPTMSARSVILATQPLDGMTKIPVSDKQNIYDTIVGFLEKDGREILLKQHPAENPADYEFLSKRVVYAPAKMPIEALVLTANEAPIVLSISSAAGLGFERFCKRIKLIEYDDRESVKRWRNHPDELEACLRKGLAEA